MWVTYTRIWWDSSPRGFKKMRWIAHVRESECPWMIIFTSEPHVLQLGARLEVRRWTQDVRNL